MLTDISRLPKTPLLVATCAGMAVLSGCERQLNTPVANEDLQSMEADFVAYGMTMYVTANGVREGRVEADTAYIFEESSSADLHQMTIVFYDEIGNANATVTGVEGEWNRETDRMVARGDVVLIIHSDSTRIESQELHYDPQLDRIWSDSATTRVLADGTVTSGTAFESDMSFENIRIANMRGGVRRIF